jgi:hypothetical protein
MSKEQKDKVVELRKAKSAGCAVKAAITTPAVTVPNGPGADVDTRCSVSGFQQRWWMPVDRPPYKFLPMWRTLPV